MGALRDMMKKNNDYDNLMIKTRGYAYDSLCLRYTMARNAQMELELMEDKRITGGMRPEAIRRRAERDKTKFYEILDEVIGEHD